MHTGGPRPAGQDAAMLAVPTLSAGERYASSSNRELPEATCTLLLAEPGHGVMATLGTPHRLQCVPTRLLMAAGYGLLACTDHTHQAAG